MQETWSPGGASSQSPPSSTRPTTSTRPGDEVVENPDETEEFGDKDNIWSAAANGGRGTHGYPRRSRKADKTRSPLTAFHDLNGGWEFNFVLEASTWSVPSSLDGTYYKWEDHPTVSNAKITRKLTPEEARDEITDEILRTKPFHRRFLYEDIHDPELGPDIAADIDKRHRLLATGVPASSYAIAANALEKFDLQDRNHNMQTEMKNPDAEWPVHPHVPGRMKPENWAHSDFKDVAIQYVHPLYEEMIRIGGLDEDDNQQDNE